MRDFKVHFSFYSEEYGNFDEIHYTVSAADMFEAREKGWIMCDEDPETIYRSAIQVMAVTWEPNRLDVGDYFYAKASDLKCAAAYEKNVTKPNAQIDASKTAKQVDFTGSDHYYAVSVLDQVAKDLYGDKGIVPPQSMRSFITQKSFATTSVGKVRQIFYGSSWMRRGIGKQVRCLR
ncbi:MAG: hypothetical protein LBV33_07685 [Lachnospiraceae bacterium]|jgi:hypothetical protein|nr:hypothetical protein [Lachnospiraceae bacterium]